MKRYVKELANDLLSDLRRSLREFPENKDIYEERILKIESILQRCEYGYISDVCAVRLMVE